MARIKIDLPERFRFSVDIPVRITDINYGGHAGNDSILSIIHEARVQFFRSLGLGELNQGGVGLIMSDVGIEFKNELFYGDQLTVYIATNRVSDVAFDLYYKMEKKKPDNSSAVVALAKTGMVAYDYTFKKVSRLPEDVLSMLQEG